MSPDTVEGRRRAARERRVSEALANFSTLPDDAILRVHPTARICGCGPATIWRGSRLGTFPAPVKLSPKITGWRVGELRRYLADPQAVRDALAAKRAKAA
jgi:prophage regulatory protein